MGEFEDLEEIDLTPTRNATPKIVRAGRKHFMASNERTAMLPKWKRQLRAGNKRLAK